MTRAELGSTLTRHFNVLAKRMDANGAKMTDRDYSDCLRSLCQAANLIGRFYVDDDRPARKEE